MRRYYSVYMGMQLNIYRVLYCSNLQLVQMTVFSLINFMKKGRDFDVSLIFSEKNHKIFSRVTMESLSSRGNFEIIQPSLSLIIFPSLQYLTHA